MESSRPGGPVFVDPSGRRHRLVVRAAWLLAALGAAYIGLVVVSLLLPPSVSRLSVPGLGPVLPGPGAAALGDAAGEDSRPDVLLARSPSPAPPRSTRSPRPVPSPTPVTVARTGSPSPSASASPTGTASPTVAPRPTNASTAAPTAPPGQSEPPGQASRSPRPRPTPSKGPR